MFDKTERQFFRGHDIEPVVRTMEQVLYTQGIPLQQTGPNAWAGRGQMPSYGLVARVSIFVMPTPEGFSVDLRVSADTEGSGLVIFIVSWFFFFPVAIILGYMAYQDFTQRQAQLHYALWAPVSHLFIAPNFAPAFGGYHQGPPAS